MLLLYNGTIYCEKHFEEAILIDGEFIKDIGKTADLQAKYPEAKSVDLEKKLLLPGFNDAHMHILGYAKAKHSLNLQKTKSISEVIEMGKEYLQQNTSILFGGGYNQENFLEKRILTRYDLDQISEEIPIVIHRVCGHIATVNSKAFEILQLDTAEIPQGGSIDTDANGVWTGVLRENALSLLDSFGSNFSVEELKAFLSEALKDAIKVGITSIGTNDINTDIDAGNRILNAYYELYQENMLPVRITHQITFEDTKLLEDFRKAHPIHNPYLQIGPLKLFIDGSLGAKTAYVKKKYHGENHKGILCIPERQLKTILGYCEQNQIQVIIHSIGDKASSICLRAFSRKMRKHNPLRHAIVHVQITDKAILKQFRRLGIGAIVQPIFINTDMNLMESRINEKTARTSYAFNTLLNTVATAFSSDAPVEDFNPLLGIYSSVTRLNLEGTKALNRNEKTSIRDAVDAYTINPAYMTFEETVKGKIAVGYYADLVLLRDNIFAISPQEIKNTKVDMTIVGGNIVYQRGI